MYGNLDTVFYTVQIALTSKGGWFVPGFGLLVRHVLTLLLYVSGRALSISPTRYVHVVTRRRSLGMLYHLK